MRNYSFDINDPITGFSFLISNLIMLTCFNQTANVFISWGKSYHKQLNYLTPVLKCYNFLSLNKFKYCRKTQEQI